MEGRVFLSRPFSFYCGLDLVFSCCSAALKIVVNLDRQLCFSVRKRQQMLYPETRLRSLTHTLSLTSSHIDALVVTKRQDTIEKPLPLLHTVLFKNRLKVNLAFKTFQY